MKTNFENDMPDRIYDEWNGYTKKQQRFLMYMLSEQLKQEDCYINAGYGKAGAKPNSYKLLKKLQTVWEWLEYWKAHQAASEGVISKNEMLKEYSARFRDADTSNSDLIKLGKEIATLCVYYPDQKQGLVKGELEIQEIINTKELPLELRKQMALAIKEQKKLAELGEGQPD